MKRKLDSISLQYLQNLVKKNILKEEEKQNNSIKNPENIELI